MHSFLEAVIQALASGHTTLFKKGMRIQDGNGWKEADGQSGGVILLVGPSVYNWQTLVNDLGLSPDQVVQVSTTEEAVSAISFGRVDLVIVADKAPELGAVEFCRMLKRTPATQFLPVFVAFESVAFESEDADAEVKAIEAGADAILARPFRPRAIRARIQASLRQKAKIDALDDSETVLVSLAQSVEQRDPALAQHCERLASMAAGMGMSLGLPAGDVIALQRGGYLHDVGKIAIPDQILFKEGPLTPEEWEVMKSHTERGARICSNMRSLESVVPIIRHHHEKWDGSGYPSGLKGTEIPLLARILQVADIYDSLTTHRPYKAALPPEEALRMIQQEVARGWRDPQLVNQFADILPTLANPANVDLPRYSLQALALSLQRLDDSGRSVLRMGQCEFQTRRV